MSFRNCFKYVHLFGFLFLNCRPNVNNQCLFNNIPVVFKDINLNLIQYSDLTFERSFIYEPGGISGLVIYRETGNIYRVFDRASPISPNNPNARLYVDASRQFLRDSVNNAQYDFEGNVVFGSKNCPLLRYNAIYVPPFLSIRNF
ncbi:MAG: hypothetical protein SNJ77_05700 [Cytophagales bacterium]